MRGDAADRLAFDKDACQLALPTIAPPPPPGLSLFLSLSLSLSIPALPTLELLLLTKLLAVGGGMVDTKETE